MYIREVVSQKCLDVFRNVFFDLNLCVCDDTSPSDIESWDSLAQISLVLVLEQVFEIEFSIDEAESLKNFGEIVDSVFEKIHA